jgi:hypothetical protein
MKERYGQAQARMAAMQSEKAQMQLTNDRLEAQAQAAGEEVQSAERAPTASQQEALKFKRNCRVFERPEKGAKVLAIQPPGSQVSKSDEGKSWIAFPMPDGRKGFAAKSCF